MCLLCTEPERGQREMDHLAENLERMALICRKFAQGTLKPHQDNATGAYYLACELIRQLVAEWI